MLETSGESRVFLITLGLHSYIHKEFDYCSCLLLIGITDYVLASFMFVFDPSFLWRKILWKITNNIYIHQLLKQQQQVFSWYHEYLLHSGQTRTEKTIRNTMTWPGLTQDVEHWTLIVYVPFVKYVK
jgi:hypothetical protein